LRDRRIGGRFGYSDLKEASLRGNLWVLYVIEQVPMIFEVAVGGGARHLQCERVQRRVAPECAVEVEVRVVEAHRVK
jgi:hypothetical protein